LEVLSTGEQARLSYAAAEYVSFQVGSAGDLTITPSGTGEDTVGIAGAFTSRAFEVIKAASATLTAAESNGTTITNYGETDDAHLILTLPDLDTTPGANFLLTTVTDMTTYDFGIKAAADNHFILDGVAGADNGCILAADPAPYDKLSCVAITNGSSTVYIDCETVRGTWAIVADNTGSCPN